ncbi:hypothetical protein HYV11_03170 [Candidatus Dependentiae bacterium]|nr:hypothetical protein [Candidatus Dependentiae bacterium]
MKKYIFLLLILVAYKAESFTYINGENVTLKRFISGSRLMKMQYNPLHAGDDQIGSDKRNFGIHNMSIEIPGYETVSLIDNGYCREPKLFTLFAQLFSKDNGFVQRNACVKYLPLSFGFKVDNDTLVVSTAVSKYSILAPFLTKSWISLQKKPNCCQELENKNIELLVKINGRAAAVSCKDILTVKNAAFDKARLLLLLNKYSFSFNRSVHFHKS